MSKTYLLHSRCFSEVSDAISIQSTAEVESPIKDSACDNMHKLAIHTFVSTSKFDLVWTFSSHFNLTRFSHCVRNMIHPLHQHDEHKRDAAVDVKTLIR